MLKNIFILLVIGFGIYTGIQFAIPQYHYYMFKSDVDELSQLTSLPMKELLSEVLQSAQDANLPIEEEDIHLSRVTDGSRIQAAWQETVNIFDLYKKTYYFSVDAQP